MKKYKYKLAIGYDSFTAYFYGNTKKELENSINNLINEVDRIKYIYNANFQFGFQNRIEVNTKKEIYQFIKNL